LNLNGTPSNNILFSAIDVPNIDNIWNTYQFSTPIECPNGFMLAVSGPGYIALGTSDPTVEYPFEYNTHCYPQGGDYLSGNWTFFENAPTPIIRIPMIRAVGVPNYDIMLGGGRTNVNTATSPFATVTASTETNNMEVPQVVETTPIYSGEPVYNKSETTRTLVDYSVYRLLEGETDPNEWVLIADHVSALTATDNTWEEAATAIYQFAVVANYTNNVSEPKFSNSLPKGMEAGFTINITSNTGKPIDGAFVTIVNQNGNPDHEYSLTANASTVVFPRVWLGTYNIKIKLPKYYDYIATDIEITTSGLSHSAVLIEMMFPVIDPVAEIVDHNAVITWATFEEQTYILDDGTAETGWGMNPNTIGWLGNKFVVEEVGEITSVDIYAVATSNNTNRWVTLDIFDDDLRLIGSSQPFILQGDDWTRVTLNNIPYSGTFYAMVHWHAAPGQSHLLGIDYTGPHGVDNLEYYRTAAGEWYLFRTVVQQPYTNVGGVFMIRVNAQVFGSRNSNSDVDYAVYRLTEGDAEENWSLLSDEIANTTYTDTDWLILPEGVYQYAVKARYTGGFLSKATFSNVLAKDMYVDYKITVTTNNGGKKASCTVTVTATSTQKYLATTLIGEVGFAPTFPNWKKGMQAVAHVLISCSYIYPTVLTIMYFMRKKQVSSIIIGTMMLFGEAIYRQLRNGRMPSDTCPSRIN